jgi:hypothetical protein
MKRLILVLAALLALPLFSKPAAAQDEWLAQVRRYLARGGAAFEERGFQMTHRIYTGSLNDDGGENVSVALEAGREYMIAGACDNDCSDLDFTLFDAAGNEIDEDVELDDFPIVSVTPRRSGQYRVRVLMASCSAEPCRYGVGVWAK